MSKLSSLKFKNYQFEHLVRWLDLSLHGGESRLRNKLVKLIAPHVQSFEKERLALLEKYTPKDETGKPKMIENGKKFAIYGTEGWDPYQKEIQELNNEEVIIDILDSNKEVLKFAKKLLFDDIGKAQSFTIETGIVYDELCEIFEPL